MANANAAAQAQGVTPDDLAAQIAALSGRMTTAEAGLSKAVADFTPVGKRVSELSAAFQEANARLAALETAITEIRAAQALPPDDRLSAVEAALSGLTDRLAAVEQTRARGGRLSQRLASIESKLDQIAGGGTTV